ncbi:MAG: chromate transporter [Clostridia bacterium]|nr:chromate transporter [Clostridia bacterium]
MEKTLRNYFKIFITFIRISLFTFGGGYTMISLLQIELVIKKKWINEGEFMSVVAIAESTPGPIAINCATYVGYKMLGFLGSIVATIAVILPSFAIIYGISLVFNRFLEFELVAKAFMGIKAAVAVLIIAAGLRMIKKSKKSVLALVLFVLAAAALAVLNIFAVNFSSVYLILIGGIVGVLVMAFKETINKTKKNMETNEATEEKTPININEDTTGETDVITDNNNQVIKEDKTDDLS